MRTHSWVVKLLCALWMGLALLTSWGQAAETQDAAKLFPDSTLVYVDLRQPDEVLNYALHPDVLAAIVKSEQFQQGIANGQIGQLQKLVAYFEGKIGTDWQNGLRKLIRGGVQIGFDPPTAAPLLVVQASDAEFLNKLHAAAVEAIEADHKNRGASSPIKSEEYRGHKGYSFGNNEAHVIVGNLLLVSTRPEPLKRAIDRKLDGNGKSLASVEDFQKARQLAGENPTGWAFLRMDHVRNLPGLDQVFESTKGNPALEVLFGGILETAKSSPLAVARLDVRQGLAKLNVRLPRDVDKVAVNRRWHFAPQGGQASTPLRVKGHIATFSSYRDLEGLWNAREELFNEEIGRQLTQAESQLALFFGKQDFGAEVLAELGPRATLVVARQEYAADRPVPTNRLPAFAMLWDLPHPDEMSQDLLSVYQKLVGLVNLGGGQQGFTPLLLGTVNYKGVQVSTADYKLKKDMPLTNAPFQYNFSPSCAQIGSRFVIGSTTGIVRDLVDLFQDAKPGPSDDANSLVEIDTQAVANALELNREFFVSQQMLSQGKSHDEADSQLGVLYQLLRGALAARLKLIDTNGTLDLELSVGQLP